MQPAQEQQHHERGQGDDDPLPLSRILEHLLCGGDASRLKDLLQKRLRIDLLAGAWVGTAVRTESGRRIDLVTAGRADRFTHRGARLS